MRSVIIDAFGSLYVTDDGDGLTSEQSFIRVIVIATRNVSTLAGGGCQTRDGRGTSACFRDPAGLTLANNILYVTDSTNIQAVDINTRNVSLIAGGSVYGYNDGIGTNAHFTSAYGIFANRSSGNLYVADYSVSLYYEFATIRVIAVNATVLPALPAQSPTTYTSKTAAIVGGVFAAVVVVAAAGFIIYKCEFITFGQRSHPAQTKMRLISEDA